MSGARIWLSVAALLGALGVVLGALGAHALEATLTTRGHVATWETAVLYHLVHAVALLAIALAGGRRTGLVAGCWTAGTVAFSGSLYLLALGGPGFLGPVTPLGGLLLIAGWLLLPFALRRSKP